MLQHEQSHFLSWFMRVISYLALKFYEQYINCTNFVTTENFDMITIPFKSNMIVEIILGTRNFQYFSQLDFLCMAINNAFQDY